MDKKQKHTSGHTPGNLKIDRTTPLRRGVWLARRGVRRVTGRDILNADHPDAVRRHKLRRAYRKVDEFAVAFFPNLVKTTPKKMAMGEVRDMIDQLDYTIVDKDEQRPWGAFYRLHDNDADRFIAEFFPGLSPEEARLGNKDVKLSPKFLLVSPGQRLSWQYHHRRAERWHFLLAGAYHKSISDTQGEKIIAPSGTVIQFAQGERHRLCSATDDKYTLVAEIWQHTAPSEPSDEADIIRLSDDYARG